MSEDKSKSSLALELMDDLLSDEPAAFTSSKRTSATGDRRPDLRPPTEEDDRTVDLAQQSPDPTQRIAQTLPVAINPQSTPQRRQNDEPGAVRASVGRPAAFRTSGSPSTTEAALAQSESLRIAQNRILELENEVERLRQQNEEFGAAGETLRRRADELITENQRLDADFRHAESVFEQERGILSSAKEALQRDVEAGRRRVEELELRISTNIQKIRVRERELENRLELVKMEGAALIRTKDEMILDAKRTIDQLNMELNNYRGKNQELNRHANDKQDMLRRTVKALRLALSMLEGEDDQPRPQPRKVK